MCQEAAKQAQGMMGAGQITGFAAQGCAQREPTVREHLIRTTHELVERLNKLRAIYQRLPPRELDMPVSEYHKLHNIDGYDF